MHRSSFLCILRKLLIKLKIFAYLGAIKGNDFNCCAPFFENLTKSSIKQFTKSNDAVDVGPNCCIHVPDAHST